LVEAKSSSSFSVIEDSISFDALEVALLDVSPLGGQRRAGGFLLCFRFGSLLSVDASLP